MVGAFLVASLACLIAGGCDKGTPKAPDPPKAEAGTAPAAKDPPAADSSPKAALEAILSLAKQEQYEAIREHVYPLVDASRGERGDIPKQIIDGIKRQKPIGDFAYSHEALALIIEKHMDVFVPLPKAKKTVQEALRRGVFASDAALKQMAEERPNDILIFDRLLVHMVLVKVEGKWKLLFWENLPAILGGGQRPRPRTDPSKLPTAPPPPPAMLFNSDLTLAVYVEHEPGSALDRLPPQGFEFVGATPSRKPIPIPDGRLWLIQPRNVSFAKVLEEAKRCRAPGLVIPGAIRRGDLARLGSLPSLTVLWTHHSIDDAGLAEIARLTKLQVLQAMGGGRITDDGVRHLTALTNLRSLCLSGVLVTDAGLRHIAALRELRTLTVGGPRISDAGMRSLEGLTELRTLGVSGASSLTGDGLQFLRKLTRLRMLTVTQSGLTDAGLAHLAGLSELESLYLTGSAKLTGTGLAHIAGLPRLSKLYLAFCDEMSDAGLAHVGRMTALEELSLTSCKKITDAGLAHLKGLSQLKMLGLGGCAGITDAGLAHLRGLTQLEHLLLKNCAGITDAGLVHLHGLTRLEQLRVPLDAGITMDGLAGLRKALPKCRVR
jgi:hypothetical protein